MAIATSAATNSARRPRGDGTPAIGFDAPPPARDDREAHRRYFDAVRGASAALAAPLSAEDMQVQSMADVSPTKWHLAHTSWFFETFILKPHSAGYAPFHEAYEVLFNSYYNAIGEQFSRPHRGLLSRPSIADIRAYRAHVDRAMAALIESASQTLWRTLQPLLVMGVNHEQQHQELILMDIKHVLSQNPLKPAAYPDIETAEPSDTVTMGWTGFEGGRVSLGAERERFAFDNEGPRHEALLYPFELGTRLVTNGDFLAFIEEGGYREPRFWLSDGWAQITQEGWTAPLYWRRDEHGVWQEFTLHGERPLDPARPLTHISFYEAAAYADWAEARLPSEAELEVATRACGDLEAANLLDVDPAGHGPASEVRPRAAERDGLGQLVGDVWQWTRSAYAPYPGYRASAGAVGEYNGKFMCDQWVLRGGCCATPRGHIRASYRNFFPSPARWAFSGLRLARDA